MRLEDHLDFDVAAYGLNDPQYLSLRLRATHLDSATPDWHEISQPEHARIRRKVVSSTLVQPT